MTLACGCDASVNLAEGIFKDTITEKTRKALDPAFATFVKFGPQLIDSEYQLAGLRRSSGPAAASLAPRRVSLVPAFVFPRSLRPQAGKDA